LLFLHAGPDQQRQILRQEHRGAWSTALPLVLEKHGVLGLRTCTPETFAAMRRDGEPVLVTRLPADAWTPELIALVLESDAPMLLEAPLPPPLLEAIGAHRDGDDVPRDAPLLVIDRELHRAARERTGFAGGRLGPTLVRPIDRDAALAWDVCADSPMDPAVASAWGEPGWDLERWRLEPETEVLAQWRPADGDPCPGLVRRGKIFVASYGLFAALGQAHSSEPVAGAESRASPRPTGHEGLLLAIVDRLHDLAGAGSARILPWPQGTTWALTVRHDMDRRLTAREMQWRLDAHNRLGTRATWYWRALHLRSARRGVRSLTAPGALSGRRALRVVARDPRHEVALHTERLGEAGRPERALVERVLGAPVVGSCAHGAPDCFRYQGAPNVLWAEAAGMSYTELIHQAHVHPHRFPALREDGRIEALNVICLPHHHSLDRSTKPGNANVEQVLAMQELFARIGGLYQLMNHPDLNQPELFDLLAAVPREGRLDLTAAEAADWWRRTHSAEELTAKQTADGAWQLTARSEVRGLQVELRAPGGATVARTVDLAPGAPVAVAA
jgi:hypothetical protein